MIPIYLYLYLNTWLKPFYRSVVMAKGKGSHMTRNIKNPYAVAKCLRRRVESTHFDAIGFSPSNVVRLLSSVSVIWSNNLSVCIFCSKDIFWWILFIMLSVIGFNFICEAPERADNGNIQENPPKYYHSVRGDFDGLTEWGSWMCPEEESTFADTNEWSR